MTRHPLDQRLPLDIWREIKTYIVHNIKTQGKHLKKEKSVINFNKTLKNLPTFTPPTSGPQIIFNATVRSGSRRLLPPAVRVARYIYHVQAFKPVEDAAEPYRDGKISLIVTCPLKLRKTVSRSSVKYTSHNGKDYLYHRSDYQKYWSGTNNSGYIDVQEWP